MTIATRLPLEANGVNFSVKDEIRDYWTNRAETFDLSFGHRIRTDAELSAWVSLFRRHGRIAAGSRVLELASVTGEITRVLTRIGCDIDAIDLCEAMIERARRKHPETCVRFHLGDAENTMMADNAYDAVVCRHLVWTLVDPVAAFADWWRVLKPGGRLVIADGDWVSATALSRFLLTVSRMLDRLRGIRPLWDQAAHERIMAKVHFREGLKARELHLMLADAGFTGVQLDTLSCVRRRQWRAATWSERLRLAATYGGRTFLLSATKPAA
ncbi:methyltransferase domain-containing protein [Stappia sp.]|uniref:class I SAM-dependent methyltransferase n=1 Tax=Stappia sp. TaxID=1870903 RepID=UPI003A98DE7B